MGAMVSGRKSARSVPSFLLRTAPARKSPAVTAPATLRRERSSRTSAAPIRQPSGRSLYALAAPPSCQKVNAELPAATRAASRAAGAPAHRTAPSQRISSSAGKNIA